MKLIISGDMGFSKGADLPQTTATSTESKTVILYILRLKHVQTKATF